MSAYLRPAVIGNFRQPKPHKNSGHQKKREGMSEAHCKLIRKLPCVSCGVIPAGTVHHLKSGPAAAERGVQLKATDQWGTPLCRICHDDVEKIGSRREVEWFAKFGVDPHALARALWNGRHDEARMTAIVIAHRRGMPTLTTEQEIAMKTPIAEQIAEANRERDMRARLYPIWCKAGRLDIAQGAAQQDRWRKIIEVLEYCQANRDAINTAIKTMAGEEFIGPEVTALIVEARRELGLRESTYANLVAAGKMTMVDSSIRIKRVRAMIGTLEFYGRNKRKIETAVEVVGSPEIDRVMKEFPGATVTGIHERAEAR